MRSLLLFLLLPSRLFAQENDDYLKLIREDSSRLPAADSARDIRLPRCGFPVGNIIIFPT